MQASQNSNNFNSKDSHKRPLSRKEIVVLLTAFVFIVIPFILAPLAAIEVWPSSKLVVILYGTWWKRLSFIVAGLSLSWLFGILIDKRCA